MKTKRLLTLALCLLLIAVVCLTGEVIAPVQAQYGRTAIVLVSTAFVDGGDGLPEHYVLTYINQDGVAGSGWDKVDYDSKAYFVTLLPSELVSMQSTATTFERELVLA